MGQLPIRPPLLPQNSSLNTWFCPTSDGPLFGKVLAKQSSFLVEGTTTVHCIFPNALSLDDLSLNDQFKEI